MTVATNALSLDSYLNTGATMTYAEMTLGGTGTFTVPTFRTSADPTLKRVDLGQGTTGFVRVRKPNESDEIYTIHGQNIMALENATFSHGYAFRLAPKPTGLDAGVDVPRPTTAVDVSHLRGDRGQKEPIFAVLGGAPYVIPFAQDLDGDDVVQARVFYCFVANCTADEGPVNELVLTPLRSTVDSGTGLVSGKGSCQHPDGRVN